MDYVNYQYLWPPRPENKVPQTALNFYQQRGYWAQLKKNGTCTVIFARGERVIFKTRHDDDHKLWTPNRETIEFFHSDGDKWNVFVAELLHSKVKGIRDQLYIFDQLVSDGVQLVGTTFAERQEALLKRWPRMEEVGPTDLRQYRVGPHVMIAKNYTSGFDTLFKQLGPEDEGLVLKDPKAKLKPCFKADSNAGWQVKSRVPHKNYAF